MFDSDDKERRAEEELYRAALEEMKQGGGRSLTEVIEEIVRELKSDGKAET